MGFARQPEFGLYVTCYLCLTPSNGETFDTVEVFASMSKIGAKKSGKSS